MGQHPFIDVRDGAGGPRAALIGTRLDVWQVIETIRQNDDSIAAAAEYLRVPASAVEACAAYHAAHRDEIDAWIARAHDAAVRAELS